MMDIPLSPSRADRLAHEIVEQARGTLLLHLRYMAVAIGRLEPRLSPGVPLGTNGAHILYSTDHVLDVYRREPQALTRDLLHGVLHCVFSHPFVDSGIDQARWSLACDMAVENAINTLGLERLSALRQGEQAGLLATLPPSIGPLTAERIYRWLIDSDADVAALRQAFHADNHSLWYVDPEGHQSMSDDGDAETKSAKSRREKAQEWKAVSERIQVDAETISHRQEGGAGSIVQNISAVTRERYDYAAFLRRFAVAQEELRESPDEFDYVFYTYGLRLYGNLPLIEPLEYQEVVRIKEFVIAIDTSGSVSGEQVQRFVQKTYNMLKQSESFGSRVHVRIIQCDAEIRDEAVIRNEADFEAYMAALRLRGFGGTDFRPVFRHVDSLIERGELTELRGLIYFTDGQGIFPEAMPRYQTAFVFVEDAPRALPRVPVWAIRLVLRPEEI